jgi:hypothetical protein
MAMLNPVRGREETDEAEALLLVRLLLALLDLATEDALPPVAPADDAPALLALLAGAALESEDAWQASRNCMVHPPEHMPVSSQLGGVQ